MIEKGNKKTIKGWIFYDWANSVYNLVISSAIFPIFYDNVTTRAFLDNYNAENGLSLTKVPDDVNVVVSIFGTHLSPSVLMSFTLSISFLVVSILSPMLSGIADVTGSKKRFMQFFCYLGALSCISLYWFGKAPFEIGMLSVFLASIGFWNSLVFYNAFLPEIAAPEEHDKISASGYTMGYLGSMILLVICLAIIMGIGDKYTSLSFILVGIWWVSFSQISFRVLPNNVYNKQKTSNKLMKGFSELKAVMSEFRGLKKLKRYLLSFFFFNTGVQTVMLMAVLYAKREIFSGEYEDQATTGLILAILLIQLLGALGAYILSRVSNFIGNIKSLIISVTIWVALCIWAYFIKTPMEFYYLASGVGLVMGGTQSLARSTYSKFLPKTENHASYFSFYDVTEKVGIVFGTLFFGLMEYLTDDLRSSILSVIFFFSIGLLLLLFVPKEEDKEETDFDKQLTQDNPVLDYLS
ncbi:MAG: MFS transporter [Crocinitomicaceae bacterium]|nr:MFS transporter [Crocinitomicaceae bacterium]